MSKPTYKDSLYLLFQRLCTLYILFAILSRKKILFFKQKFYKFNLKLFVLLYLFYLFINRTNPFAHLVLYFYYIYYFFFIIILLFFLYSICSLIFSSFLLYDYFIIFIFRFNFHFIYFPLI